MSAEAGTTIVLTAADKTKEAFESVERNFTMLKSSAEGLDTFAAKLPVIGGALATAFGTVSFVEFVHGAIEAEGALYDLAKQSGTTVETLSAMKEPAKLANTSLDQVAESVRKLAISLGEAKLKGGEKAKLFESLGIDPKETNDAGLALYDLAKRLDGMSDRYKALSIARDLAGKSVSMPFLEQLAEEERLVARLTTAQAQQAKLFEDNMIRLRSGAGYIGIALANSALPAMNDILQFSLEIKKEWGAIAAIVAGIGGGTALKALGIEVDPLKRSVQEASQAFDSLASARKRLSEAEAAANLKDAQLIPGLADLRQSRVKAAQKDVEDAERILRSAIARNGRLQEEAAAEAARARKKGGLDLADGILGPDQRDRFADLMAEVNGVSKSFYEDLKVLEGGYHSGRIGLDEYTSAVERLIQKQPFAIKLAQEDAKAREDQAKVLERVWRAEEHADKVQTDFAVGHAKRIAEIQAQIDSIGMSPEQIERIQKLVEIEKDFQKAEAEIRSHLKTMGGTEELDARLGKLQRDKEQAIAETDAKLAQKRAEFDAWNADWTNGMNKGFDDYVRTAKNAADATSQAMSRGFSLAEDALTDMVQHGKLNLRDLANYAEAEFIRIAMVRPVVSAGADFLKSNSGSILKGIKSIFGFSEGGIMSSEGPLPLRKYSGGGIAASPQLAMFGEGGVPEAYVPVPSGRIPVELNGANAGPQVTIQQHIYPSPGVSSSDLGQAMIAAKNAAVAEVHDAMRRGSWD